MTRSPRSTPVVAIARRTSSARASVFSGSPGGIEWVQSALTAWSGATFVSVTAKRLPSSGWKKPARSSPGPTNTG